ncbi:DUF4350 domain-containing protein [Marichromatium sp. AB31]|uniref:DUF4350 domain-containing protein n=1 Tax=Marichromatium sp. AB31 TaxID=2483362 RepID=UPI000F407805|nr:DUF4350 domain-containing protein [Marichromatium sp. AB31]RNE92139.1 DUF4350 domain-containing protein [Marichromatium sp. AB31]
MRTEQRLLALTLGGTGLVLVAVLASWFLTHFERRVEQVPVGPSAAARANPLLAFERFLIGLGIAVESRPDHGLLAAPPPPGDTLVVRAPGPLSPRQRDRLRDWIAAGGRLVTTPGTGPRHALLETFGIHPESWTESGPPTPVRLRPTPGAPPLEVALDPGRTLCVSHGDKQRCGQPLTHREIGAGRLSVLADLDILTRQRIGERDHALFGARLVAPAPGGTVWLLYAETPPGLLARLWAQAPLALIAAALTLAVWLWSLGARLGPTLAPAPPPARDRLVHLEAGARFLWRHRRIRALLAASRARVLRLWARRLPGLARAPRQQRLTRLAAASGESRARLAQALEETPRSARALITLTHTLARLEQQARSPGGNRESTDP